MQTMSRRESISSDTSDTLDAEMAAQTGGQSRRNRGPAKQAASSEFSVAVTGIVDAPRVSPRKSANNTWDVVSGKILVRSIAPSADGYVCVVPGDKSGPLCVDLKPTTGSIKAGTLGYADPNEGYECVRVEVGVLLPYEGNKTAFAKGLPNMERGAHVRMHLRARGFRRQDGTPTVSVSVVAAEPMPDCVGWHALREELEQAHSHAPPVDFPEDAPFGGYPVPGHLRLVTGTRMPRVTVPSPPGDATRGTWTSGVAITKIQPQDPTKDTPFHITFELDVLGKVPDGEAEAPASTTLRPQWRVVEKVTVWRRDMPAVPGFSPEEMERLWTAHGESDTVPLVLFYWGGTKKDSAKRVIKDARGPVTDVSSVDAAALREKGIELRAGTAVCEAQAVLLLPRWDYWVAYSGHFALLDRGSKVVAEALSSTADPPLEVDGQLAADMRERVPGAATLVTAALHGVPEFDPGAENLIYAAYKVDGPLSAKARERLGKLDCASEEYADTLDMVLEPEKRRVVAVYVDANTLAAIKVAGKLPGAEATIPQRRRKRYGAPPKEEEDGERSPKRPKRETSEDSVAGSF